MISNTDLFRILVTINPTSVSLYRLAGVGFFYGKLGKVDFFCIVTSPQNRGHVPSPQNQFNLAPLIQRFVRQAIYHSLRDYQSKTIERHDPQGYQGPDIPGLPERYEMPHF